MSCGGNRGSIGELISEETCKRKCKLGRLYRPGYGKSELVQNANNIFGIYKKVERNFPEAREVFKKDRLTIGKAFIEIAKQHDMTIRPCAEGNDLQACGADCSGCMTVKIFETALHARLDVPKRSKNQRNNECACFLGTDIGTYDTCGHLCRYCYANTNAALVRENMKKHNPKSQFLIGNSQPGDVIHEAEQKSWIDN